MGNVNDGSALWLIGGLFLSRGGFLCRSEGGWCKLRSDRVVVNGDRGAVISDNEGNE